MEAEIHIVVPGHPVPWMRPRFKGKQAFSAQRHREYHELIRIFAAEAMRGRKPFAGNVAMEVLAVFAIPKSFSRSKRQEALDGHLGVGVPDLDNLEKNWDALNGIVFDDDKQIQRNSSAKRYGEEPRLEFRISPYDGAKSRRAG